MSEKSTAEKLALKPGRSLRVLHAPAGYIESLTPLPGFCKFASESEPADVIQLFVSTFSQMRQKLEEILPSLKTETIFWVAYPKASGSIKSDLNRDILREHAVTLGLKSVSLISLDDDWSAMRFKKI